MAEPLPDELMNIPEFSIEADKNTWYFPGAQVSPYMAEARSCAYTGGQILYGMDGQLLTFANLQVLRFLAIKAIKGEDLEGVPQASIDNAVRLFYNNLHVAVTLENPRRKIEGLMSERTNDALDCRQAGVEEGCLTVRWIQRPRVIQHKDKVHTYEEGDGSKVYTARLPINQGLVVETDDGMYNPETGIPFAVESKLEYEHNQEKAASVEEHYQELGRRILTHGKESPDIPSNKYLDLPLDELVKLPMIMGCFFSFFVADVVRQPRFSFADIKLDDWVDDLKTGYWFSHHFSDGPLEPKDFMLVMRALPEVIDPFATVLSYNNKDECSVQWRRALYFD